MDKYSLSMRVMHWIMAFLIIVLLAVGLWMESLPNDYPGKYDVYALHKSFGVIALAFIIFRLSVRMRSKIPALPKNITKFDASLAAATVVLLYVCMFAMPLSGYLMSTFGGHPVQLFGIPLPSLFSENMEAAKFNRMIHGYAGYGLIAIIVLHILGSFKHLLVEKVNLFKRMW